MGVFLRITGEFLVILCGLPREYMEVSILGTMTVLLVLGTIYTVAGGMLSVLITDFLQFIVMSAGLIAVTVLILVRVGWEPLATNVGNRYGAGAFNPFLNSDMGGWQFVLANVFENTASVLTWQTMISRLLSAKDAKIGRQIYTRTSFFFVCRFLIPGIWGMAALAMLTPGALSVLGHPECAARWAMPYFLSTFVPVGLMGLLLAAMLAADMSSTSSYMITWGSVIYNDILAPFHKRRWSEKTGLLWNRIIVGLIGVFLMVYGLWYPLKGNLWDYLVQTGTIYLASLSTLLIACCYWKRSNSWGAAGAIIVGAIIPTGFLVLKAMDSTADLAERIGDYYPVIVAFVGTWIAMVVGSLLKPRETVLATVRR